MKEKWESPTINVEKFSANESVAACYEVYCYFPNNNSWGYLYRDSNKNGYLDKNDQKISSLPLQGDGVAEFTGSYPQNNGFVVPENDLGHFRWDGKYTGTANPVFVYYGAKLPGDDHLNWHASDLSDPKNVNAVKDVSTPSHPNRS